MAGNGFQKPLPVIAIAAHLRSVVGFPSLPLEATVYPVEFLVVFDLMRTLAQRFPSGTEAAGAILTSLPFDVLLLATAESYTTDVQPAVDAWIAKHPDLPPNLEFVLNLENLSAPDGLHSFHLTRKAKSGLAGAVIDSLVSVFADKESERTGAIMKLNKIPYEATTVGFAHESFIRCALDSWLVCAPDLQKENLFRDSHEH